MLDDYVGKSVDKEDMGKPRKLTTNWQIMKYEDLLEAMSHDQRKFIMAYNGDAHETCDSLGLHWPTVKKYTGVGYMRRALRLRAETEDIPELIASRQERQMLWTDIMRTSEDPEMQLKASTLLGKSEADFVERRVIEGGDQPLRVVGRIELNERIEQLKEGTKIVYDSTPKLVEAVAEVVEDLSFLE